MTFPQVPLSSLLPIGIVAVLILIVLACLAADTARTTRLARQTFYTEGSRSQSGGILPLLVLAVLLFLAYLCWPWIATHWSSFLPATMTSHVTTTQFLPDNTSAESIVGPPTLPAAYIDRKLAEEHSPAQGLGSTLYQLSNQYHIDDAYIVALFHHESDYGKKGVVLTRNTHSLGNIKCTSGYVCAEGFRSYQTWIDGAKDLYALLYHGYVKGQASKQCPCKTASQILAIYAPQGDGNDVTTYIKSVLQDVSTYRKEAGA